MKKRFTVMLEKRVIEKIKQLNGYWKPTAIREKIEEELEAWADYNLEQLFARDYTESVNKYEK